MPTNLRYSKARRDLAKALYVIGNSELEIDNLFDVSHGTTELAFRRTGQGYSRDSILDCFKHRAKNKDQSLADLLDEIAINNGNQSFKLLCDKLGIPYSSSDFSLPLIKKPNAKKVGYNSFAELKKDVKKGLAVIQKNAKETLHNNQPINTDNLFKLVKKI